MIVLAATHHDPEGRLFDQAAQVLPHLKQSFDQITLLLTQSSTERSAQLLRESGCDLVRESDAPGGLTHLGRPRRAVVARAVELGAVHIVFCDFDRMLHWAEFYPQELAVALDQIRLRDFVVLGRTPRAFASHPRCQRDTEATINTVFAAVSGREWDVGAGARGMSRRAAEAILAGSDDQSVGVDATWPLFLLRRGGFDLVQLETEGMEFETADRYADQVAAAGGREQWIAGIDADPKQWALRLELARVEVEAMGKLTEGG